jgi:hypothetical protein
MSLKNFLLNDLQKLEDAYAKLNKIIDERVPYYVRQSFIEDHLETIGDFILYWNQHAKKLEEVSDE